MNRTVLFSLFFFYGLSLRSQNISGTVSPVIQADFSPVSQLIDSGTEAVILLDSGSSVIDASPQNEFYLTYHLFRRVLILKKTCLKELAKSEISFSPGMNGKTLKTVNAAVYNLENGKIIKQDLTDKDFFVESTKDHLSTLKFAYPNAKEGSILELEYSKKIYAPVFLDWYFQGDYPKLKSVYTIRLPEVFNFAMQLQNRKYLTNTVKQTYQKTFYAWINFEDMTVHSMTWTCLNIQPMRREAFTSTIDNYLACIKFQISAMPDHNGVSKGIFADWAWTANILLRDNQFGAALTDPSTMIRSQAKDFAAGSHSDLEKAQAIYSGVRNHFTVHGHGVYMTENRTLTELYKAGEGNVADINLMLVAMLRSQKLDANPVILATRDLGLTNPAYPLVEKYNYVVCRSVVDGKEYFLDASAPYMTFGKLPVSCYNGHARVITKETFPVFLRPDSIRESNRISVDIRNVNGSSDLQMNYRDSTNVYESVELRQQLKEKKEAAYFSAFSEKIPLKKSLDSFSVQNTKIVDRPLILQCSVTLETAGADHLYFNPSFMYAYTENPFKSAEREYPVELPYTSTQQYEFSMEVPAGYEIEELPKSQKMKLGNSDASYEYNITKTGNQIRLKAALILGKAIFEPDEYEGLRSFFTAVIQKQNEMIVFTKK